MVNVVIQNTYSFHWCQVLLDVQTAFNWTQVSVKCQFLLFFWEAEYCAAWNRWIRFCYCRSWVICCGEVCFVTVQHNDHHDAIFYIVVMRELVWSWCTECFFFAVDYRMSIFFISVGNRWQTVICSAVDFIVVSSVFGRSLNCSCLRSCLLTGMKYDFVQHWMVARVCQLLLPLADNSVPLKVTQGLGFVLVICVY